jgi:CheY-like chemotaxis protein
MVASAKSVEIDPKRTSQNWSRRNASPAARIVLSFAKLCASLSSTVKAMEVPSHGDETILMVEDDELVRMSVQSLIESLGYRVVPARDGPDALEILRHDTPIDLLFTDVVMPGGMHGPQLAAEARRLRPELKVLYTSGYPGSEYSEGVTGHQLLSKPYEADELAAKLREILEGRSA